MGRKNNNAFIKKQKAEQKRKKKEEKKKKMEARKSDPSSTKFEDMIAYVDKYGNIVSEPPEDEPKPKNPEKKD